MAIRSLQPLHLIKDPVRDSPSPQHEPDAKNHSAARPTHPHVSERLGAVLSVPHLASGKYFLEVASKGVNWGDVGSYTLTGGITR